MSICYAICGSEKSCLWKIAILLIALKRSVCIKCYATGESEKSCFSQIFYATGDWKKLFVSNYYATSERSCWSKKSLCHWWLEESCFLCPNAMQLMVWKKAICVKLLCYYWLLKELCKIVVILSEKRCLCQFDMLLVVWKGLFVSNSYASVASEKRCLHQIIMLLVALKWAVCVKLLWYSNLVTYTTNRLFFKFFDWFFYFKVAGISCFEGSEIGWCDYSRSKIIIHSM